MKMKIYKTSKEHYTFDKDHFKSATEIRGLYKKKLNIPEEKQGKDLPKNLRKAYVTDDNFGAYLRLSRASELDPRYRDVHFKNKMSAEKGFKIAKKLDSFSISEFLESGYPYLWQDEVGLSNLIIEKHKRNKFSKKWGESLFYILLSILLFLLLIWFINLPFFSGDCSLQNPRACF